MTQASTLADLLADPKSSQPAIISDSPEVVVSYRDLAEQIERLAGQLASAGPRPGDCVALVLPNGLEFLVLFLAIVRARLTAAPLNPAYKTEELVFLIQDEQVRAVIASEDNSAVSAAAARIGVTVWSPSIDSRSRVQLSGTSRSVTAAPQTSGPEDIALFLHTSGTTSRPKGVPLSHGNVCWSAHNVAEHYALTPADRTLIVMPLFHVHGLIGAALSTLRSGGTLILPSRFSASAFWALARAHRATWYSAVPTIHQVLLQRADEDGAPASSGLRFIRSCSSALAPSILAQMEDRFEAPVLEAYGMTEAAHQVASNPLPPRRHKPGSVGQGGSVEVAIIDQAGRHLGADAPGEVAVRGPNVMRGYRSNPEANAAAFADGWFRTGDEGVIDADGYLTLVGRIKELINRGGEKISPAEVDAALLEHPAVAEAAAFGVSDAKYGEEVWAAVVLKGEAEIAELQAHCRNHLADFKVPKKIHVVSALPKTETGKIQRRGLAERLK